MFFGSFVNDHQVFFEGFMRFKIRKMSQHKIVSSNCWNQVTKNFDELAARNESFGIICINIRSLTVPGKLDWLQQYLHKNLGIKVVCLTETWIGENKSGESIPEGEIKISGFQLYRQDRYRNGGGVAVYIRDTLGKRQKIELDQTAECLWIKVRLSKSGSVLIGTYYNPPRSSKYHKNSFLDNLAASLESAKTKQKHVLLIGDLNIDLAKDHASARTLQKVLQEVGMTQIVHTPTRVTTKTATLLDIIATTMPERIKAQAVVDITSLNLDHFMVGCVISV